MDHYLHASLTVQRKPLWVLLSEFLQHRWSHSFKIPPTQGIAVALLEMAKQKVESISFTKGWDGYRMNFAIMEPDYKDIENIRKHQKCCENCWLFSTAVGLHFWCLKFQIQKLQICRCFCRLEVEKLKPEDADEIDEIATASGDERPFFWCLIGISVFI